MSEWIIGIDPGQDGAMVLLAPEGRGVTATIVQSKGLTDTDTVLTLNEWWVLVHGLGGGRGHAFIERVSSSPQMGVKSAFSFGYSYGVQRACLLAAGIPFDDVVPSKWQKPFGLIRKDKDEPITQKKNRHKAKAQQLFPGIKVTHAIADALLIAEYGRRLRGGTL